VRLRFPFLLGGLAVAAMQLAFAEDAEMTLPKSVEAGAAFSIQSTGVGKATLLIVGPGQVLRRDVRLGETASFPAESLCNAGRYLVILEAEASTASGEFDVVPANKPAELSFLARPSRLPVGLRNAITGAVYVFDAYRNLIATPMPVSFELSTPSGAVQERSVTSRDGAAWTALDSTPGQGMDKFIARIGTVSSSRVITQVPGDPCKLRASARNEGQQVQLVTDPIRDCSGNAVPDGTIVTFTETYNGSQTSADVPIKRGFAAVQMPAHAGATISVASGVVMGNQMTVEK
jgi:hypothetical protein